MKKHLWMCDTIGEQKQWILDKLLEGETITDAGMFIDGIADPQKIIRQLRKEGHPIVTVYVPLTDATGTVHPKCLAWRTKQ